MTWPDLVDARLLLVVPTGSCEQHGPHLPLETDTLLACAWADALADRRADVVVAPPVWIGASGEHKGFAGTLSIGIDAMRDTAVELARSALPEPHPKQAQTRHDMAQAFSGVLFVNGHGGNAQALAEAMTILAEESRVVDVWHPRISQGDPHAGNTETSLMLHTHPASVRMELAEPGSGQRFRDIIGTVREQGLASVTPNGILGDPTTATAAHGRELFESLLEDLLVCAHALVPAPSGGAE